MIDTSREAVERLLQDVTPGPWEYEAGDPLSSVSTSVDGRYTDIAYLSLPNHAANARFIAAARDLVPALLARAEAAEAKLEKAVEALVQISRIELTFPEELRPTARAALAEIEGESHD